MQSFKEILNFIESTAGMYPVCLLPQLKKETTLKFVLKIIEASGKEIGEAVLVFLSAVKYIFKDSAVFTKLAEADNFQRYIADNADLIMKLSIEKSVQGNIPERAFPLLEILYEKVDHTPLTVIELGASFGLIGRCLLRAEKIIQNKERYFSYEQQIPDKFVEIERYLGIELNPPEKEWLLACCWDEQYELRLRNFIMDIDANDRYELIKGNAFGFSDLEPVKKLADNQAPGKIIVLTSFILYQFDSQKKEMLIDEIEEFVKNVNGFWINQAVDISRSSSKEEFFIALNGKKIIELPDDTSTSWKWINGERI